MHTHPQKPKGTVIVPAFLCTLTGCILAVGMELMGYFRAIESSLEVVWRAKPFYVSEPLVVVSQANWGIAFVVSFLCALVILDSARLWRRLLMGGIFVLLLLAAVPSLILWNVEWMPMVPAIALMWTWCCSLIYASQHRMPCDTPLTVVRNDVEMKVETIPLPVKKKNG